MPQMTKPLEKSGLSGDIRLLTALEEQSGQEPRNNR